MHFALDYGRGTLPFSVPRGVRTSVAEPSKGEPLDDPTAAIAAALENPIGTPPLGEIAAGRGSAVVVISDKTRPIPYGLVLPQILHTLEAAGVPCERTEILVATGLHRPNTEAELTEMINPEIVARYRIRNHVARDAHLHAHVGRTARGTEVWIDRGFLAADLKIVTGLIEPHLMAGFSGGRKAVVPGLAGVETMRSVHGAAMLEENVGPGIVLDNPFHAELLEIVRGVGVDFMLDVSLNRARRITGVFAGHIERAHQAGMRAVEAAVRVDLDTAADVVVTSAGGYPLDATFYQSIKGLTASLNVVRRGGTLILAAALDEGIGSADFVDLLNGAASADEYMRRIRSPGFFRVDQWMMQHLCQVLRKARVVVVSDGPCVRDLPPPLVSRAERVEVALEQALDGCGPGAHVAVLPQGPYVLATVAGQKLSLAGARRDAAA